MKDLVNKFHKDMEILIPGMEKEVNELISILENFKESYLELKTSNKEEDQKSVKQFDNHIENQLDYLSTPFTKKYFQKVLYYWGELNPESEKYYRDLYKKLF